MRAAKLLHDLLDNACQSVDKRLRRTLFEAAETLAKCKHLSIATLGRHLPRKTLWRRFNRYGLCWNVLAAEREPWLAIDPKPYVGDPAYDVTQHIFNGVFLEGADAEALAARMARLLDLDLNRIPLWLFARAVEASPYWGGMANLAQTLYPLLT